MSSVEGQDTDGVTAWSDGSGEDIKALLAVQCTAWIVAREDLRTVECVDEFHKAITVAQELEPIVDDIFSCLEFCKTDHDRVGYVKGHLPRLKKLVKKYS